MALRLAFTLALGGVGGFVFWMLDLPLPWLIGSLTATTVAALLGIKLHIPWRLRTTFIVVIGLMIGSAFSPETMSRIGALVPSAVGVCVYAVLTTVLIGYGLRRFAGFGAVDSYCAGAPGGFAEMVLLAGDLGGDERKVSLMHTMRIMLVVIVVPFAYRFYFGAPPSAVTGVGHVLDLDAVDAATLVAIAVVGFGVARVARLPLPTLIGPMFASALAHGAGWTDAKAPMELVAAAQLVMGASIGYRFSGLSLRSIGRVMVVGVFATLGMVFIGAVTAVGTWAVTGLRLDALLMAFAPGGVTEVNLVALALNIDPVFVATMHLARVAFLMLSAPLALKWMVGANKPPSTP